MMKNRAWLLPALLAAGQLAVWPVPQLAAGKPVDRVAAATAVAVVLVVGVALCRRRTSPIAVAAVVVTALGLGLWGTSGEELAVAGLAGTIALYSVAVHRRAAHSVLTGIGLAVGDALAIAVVGPVDDEYPLLVLLSVFVYSVTIAAGRTRRRWHADRAAAARRLVAAEERRRQAAESERQRLARELHDVTAHHLTSIVVTASAAQRLAARRPELVTEALEFTARTGRQTMTALHRLVSVMQTADQRPASPAERLEELADGFRRLGQVVSVDADPGELPAAAAEAVPGIAREALTNTLRYAPGSAVRLRLSSTAGGVELFVDDDGGSQPGTTGAGLGSGRGLTGMRERAEAIGGSFEAGPRAGGGWRVHAVLPTGPDAPPVTGRPWWRPRPRRSADFAAALAGWLPNALGGLAAVEGMLSPAAAALFVLLGTAQATPLLWRRERPWTTLVVVLIAAWCWPVAVALRVAPTASLELTATGLGAALVAAYAVGSFAGPTRVTWLSIGVVCGAWAVLAATLTAALAGPDAAADGMGPALLWIVIYVMTGAALVIPVALCWLAGVLVRRRRTRLRAREDDAVAQATFRAVESARAERLRVAEGLRAAVLHRTGQVSAAADDGDLDGVLRAARGALDAMRGLLSGLRDAPAGARDPQPTVAALGALRDAERVAGRDVTLHVTGAVRALPADVDVSAYRVVELALAGGTGPAVVLAQYTGASLRLAVTGVPSDPDGARHAGLRARVAAVGGSIAVGAPGTIDISMPAPATVEPAPATVEEVTSSRSE